MPSARRTAARKSARATAPSASAPIIFRRAASRDHRINLTLYKIDKVMEGEALDEILDPLIADHQASLLAASEGA